MPEPKLTYALSLSTGRLIHIADAENGLDCGCVCPECRGKLEAVNNGQKRAHHFRHNNGANCPYARMTALHMLAQQVFEEEKCVILPEYQKQYYHYPAQEKRFHTVELESNVRTTDSHLRPDCIGYDESDLSPIWVEIFVTHRVDEEKRNTIIKDHITCVEFDFSDLTDTDYTINDIKNRLLDKRHCKWVNAPIYDKRNSQAREESILKQLQERKARQEQQELQERKERQDREYIETLITTWKTSAENKASGTILDILNNTGQSSSRYRELIIGKLTPYSSFLSKAPKDIDSVRILRLLLQKVLPTDEDITIAQHILERNKNLGDNATEKQQITSLLALVIRIVGSNRNYSEIKKQFLQEGEIWKPILILASIAAKVRIGSKKPIDYGQDIETKHRDYAYAYAHLLQEQSNLTDNQISYIKKLKNIPSRNTIDPIIYTLLKPFIKRIPIQYFKRGSEQVQSSNFFSESQEDISRGIQELNHMLHFSGTDKLK